MDKSEERVIHMWMKNEKPPLHKNVHKEASRLVVAFSTNGVEIDEISDHRPR